MDRGVVSTLPIQLYAPKCWLNDTQRGRWRQGFAAARPRIPDVPAVSVSVPRKEMTAARSASLKRSESGLSVWFAMRAPAPCPPPQL